MLHFFFYIYAFATFDHCAPFEAFAFPTPTAKWASSKRFVHGQDSASNYTKDCWELTKAEQNPSREELESQTNFPAKCATCQLSGKNVTRSGKTKIGRKLKTAAPIADRWRHGRDLKKKTIYIYIYIKEEASHLLPIENYTRMPKCLFPFRNFRDLHKLCDFGLKLCLPLLYFIVVFLIFFYLFPFVGMAFVVVEARKIFLMSYKQCS